MFGDLKQASDKKKKIFAWVISGSVTLVVFILWFTFSLPSILGKGDVATKKAEETRSVLGVMKDQVASLPASVFKSLENWSASVNSTDLLDSKIEYRAE